MCIINIIKKGGGVIYYYTNLITKPDNHMCFYIRVLMQYILIILPSLPPSKLVPIAQQRVKPS